MYFRAIGSRRLRCGGKQMNGDRKVVARVEEMVIRKRIHFYPTRIFTRYAVRRVCNSFRPFRPFISLSSSRINFTFLLYLFVCHALQSVWVLRRFANDSGIAFALLEIE